VGDFYDESLRLVFLNTAFSAAALTVLVLGLYAPVAFVLLIGLGPLAAAFVYAAATKVETGTLRLLDALVGVRLCWRRGLVLWALVLAVGGLTVLALDFYAGSGTYAWPLAGFVLYVSGTFAVFQLLLWPIAMTKRDRPFRRVLGDAAIALLRRPVAATALAVALLLVNLAGLAAAVLPFLTMTIAYSVLAATRFALTPDPSTEG
jgi:hypothetical protein